jgi:hypothetical protein
MFKKTGKASSATGGSSTVIQRERFPEVADGVPTPQPGVGAGDLQPRGAGLVRQAKEASTKLRDLLS